MSFAVSAFFVACLVYSSQPPCEVSAVFCCHFADEEIKVKSTNWPQKSLTMLLLTLSHNQQTTAFRHPVTGQFSPENSEFILQEEQSPHMSKQERNQRPSSMVSETSTAGTASTLEAKPGPKIIKSSNKVHSFGKRDQAIRRNLNVPVVVRGWLHKQDSSGMRLWKRRWFVLADYCLFYYKDSREEAILGSIPLPSYVISPVAPEDRISRKYSFKAVHTGMRALIYNSSAGGSQAEQSGMRTYYFSADTQEDMNAWVRAMNQAAQVLSRSSLKRSVPIEGPPTLGGEPRKILWYLKFHP
uniref:Pleckstrin homology domain containing A7 n=1 Tax=Oryctolagus cuniculus TaxID=9986 RepID=A0A5F9D4L6_RABIT